MSIVDKFFSKYKEMYEENNEHFNLYEEIYIPKIREYVKKFGGQELNLLIKISDVGEFKRRLSAFHSELFYFLYLEKIFPEVNIEHPPKGYDYRFKLGNSIYNFECTSPRNSETNLALPKMNWDKTTIEVVNIGDPRHEKAKLRITQAIDSKLKQLKNTQDYKNSKNFIFLDFSVLFHNSGGLGIMEDDLCMLLHNIKPPRQKLSREETRINIKNKEIYGYDFSFDSNREEMKYIHGVFYILGNSLYPQPPFNEVKLFLNPSLKTNLDFNFFKQFRK